MITTFEWKCGFEIGKIDQQSASTIVFMQEWQSVCGLIWMTLYRDWQLSIVFTQNSVQNTHWLCSEHSPPTPLLQDVICLRAVKTCMFNIPTIFGIIILILLHYNRLQPKLRKSCIVIWYSPFHCNLLNV